MNTVLKIFQTKFRSLITKSSIVGLLAFVVLLYLFGTILMVAEPDTFKNIGDYTWWFFVTVTTVGYGDLYPTTTLGRGIALLVMFGGIGTIATALGKFSDYLFIQQQKRLKGKLNLKNKMKNHIVIVGYRKNVTEEIVSQIYADDSQADIVLVDDELEENANPDDYDFIKGNIVDDSVLERSNIKDAKRVLIDVDDDNKTISSLLAVVDANNGAKVVITLNNNKLNDKVRRMASNSKNEVEIVNDVRTPVMLQSIQDPGTSFVINNMLDNTVDDTIYSYVYESDKPIEVYDLKNTLTDGFESTLLAIKNNGNYDLNPESTVMVDKGTTIYYIAPKRILPNEWKSSF